VVAASSDDGGETFALFATVVPAESVPDGSIMIIPLTPPSEEDILNFIYLAREKSMFVKLHETPRERNTYGHVMSYSTSRIRSAG
jgi:hypothetical protein